MNTYLKKIELHGFKSFPEKTVVQFHKGITVIVGPNGCGKSNIVDAILWVLGEQKIKNLRGEENQDLIFNGSSSKKPLGMTEVGLFVGHKEEETYIARRFFRSGEGKYILNDKFCRNKDVQDSLYTMGIGEKSYFIFEQGSVEKMVSLKPSERRILIEEAAGIAQYLERKKETASKLIIAQQNLDNLDIILIEKGKRLKDLKNQAQYVVRYRSVKNARNELLKALLKKKSQHSQNQFETIRKDMEKELNNESRLAQEIREMEEEVLSKEQIRWEQERKLKADQQEMFQENQTIMGMRNDSEKSQQRKGFLEQRIQELLRMKKKGEMEIKELDQKENLSREESTRFEEQEKENRNRLSLIDGKLKKLEERIDALKPGEQEMKKTAFVLENDLAKINNEIIQLEKNLVRLDNECGNKKHLILELMNQTKADDLKSVEEEIESLRNEYSDAEALHHGRESDYLKMREGIGLMESSIHSQKMELDHLKNQKNKYENIRKKLQGVPSEEIQIDHEGFIQDLIEAPKSRHRILENFYFDEMDSPVMIRPVDALQVHNSKVLLCRKYHEDFPDGIKKEPGYLGTIKELFEIRKSGLKEILKEGVLVDDLGHAISIFVKYGINVSTEAGEIITRDGILIRNREKGILDVLDEIKETEQRISELIQKISETADSLKQIKEKEGSAGEEIKRGKNELNQFKERLISRQSHLELLLRNQKAGLQRLQIAQAEIGRFYEEGDYLREQLGDLRSNKESLEKKSEQFRKEKERFGEEFSQLQKEYAETEKEKVNHTHDLSLLQEKWRSLKNGARDLSSRRNSLQEQLRQSDDESGALQSEIAKLLEKIQDLDAEVKKREKGKSILAEKLKEAELEMNSTTQVIKEITARLNGQRDRRDEIREKKKELEIQIASIKKDLFQLEEFSSQELNMELREIEADPELIKKDASILDDEYNQSMQRLNKMRESDRLNFSAEAEVDIVEKDYNFLVNQKEDILKSIADMHTAIERIDRESKESFLKAFHVIRENFVRNFEILFEGGEADLALSDSENLLESGLEIQAQPPGKKLQSIRLLSGGEKTLTSLAFLFALFQYKPSPFCVFDEVDASLDEANIQRFVRFLFQLKEHTQFVIITHNFKTMENADYIYGVSMDEPGISKIYSMKMN